MPFYILFPLFVPFFVFGWLTYTNKIHFVLGSKKMIQQLKQARILYMDGDMRSGKTLFSVAFGHHMLHSGHILSCAFNFPCSFSREPTTHNQWAVMDEGGTVFDKRISLKDKNLSEILAALTFNLGKRGSYLVVPSYSQADSRLRRAVRLTRTYSPTFKPFSNLLWIYQWEKGDEDPHKRDSMNFKSGTIIFWNPRRFFNVYDTYFQPPSLTYI